MPIHIPGARDARGRRKTVAKRNVVAVLSLTAMVDLFTVLAVFLIQNYATTGEVIHIPEGVKLPDATETKELKPSNIVLVSDKEVRLNDTFISHFRTVKEQPSWMIEQLKVAVESIIQQGEEEKISMRSKIRNIMQEDPEGTSESQTDQFRKITIQADKEIDFLTIKKVMYTVMEAGIYEINFAVVKKPKEDFSSI